MKTNLLGFLTVSVLLVEKGLLPTKQDAAWRRDIFLDCQSFQASFTENDCMVQELALARLTIKNTLKEQIKELRASAILSST